MLLKSSKKNFALVTLDESSAYNIVSHLLLYDKLLHLGIHIATAKLIIDYLTDRRSYVEINTNQSTLINNGNHGVNQGSTLSGFLFLCFMIDLPQVSHEQSHYSHYNEAQCNRPNITVYVDDVYGIIVASKDQMMNSITKFITLMNRYFKNNLLKNNLDKSKFMIFSDSKLLKIKNNNVRRRRNK